MTGADSAFTTIRKFIKLYAGIGTIAAAVVAGAWTMFSFLQNAKLEYAKPFTAKQIETVFKTAETAAKLLSETDPKKWEAHKTAYWEIYSGSSILFETPAMECAMANLGIQLRRQSHSDRDQLAPGVYRLNLSLRDFLTKAKEDDWKISLTGVVNAKAAAHPVGIKEDSLTTVQQKFLAEKCKGVMS